MTSTTINRRPTKAEETSDPIPSSSQTPPAMSLSALSPFLPTTIESILLAVYPFTLFLGSTFSLLDPSSRASTYNPVTQAHQPPGPSYFATKTNIFNVFFVKQGWFWISLSYFFFLFTHPLISNPGRVRQKRIVHGIVRWALVTGWWIAITQWFFGPPIMDRAFVMTGGKCEILREKQRGADVALDMGETKQFLTSIACKSVGGTWKGGHDISGHVFMLVLGSMFLFMEVLSVVGRAMRWGEERIIVGGNGEVKHVREAPVDGEKEVVNTEDIWSIWAKVALGVAGLSVWMLLMTAAYFHTWFEKVNGLIVALIGIFTVYFLPRAVPTLRGITGLPGI